MKRNLIFILALLSLNISFGQIAFYDAINLSKLLDDKRHFINTAAQHDSLLSILSKYKGGKIIKPTDFSDSTKNPFLYKFFDKNKTYSVNFSSNVGNNIASSIGGIDVTNIADGFAKFIVKRVKQELSASFFDKFKQIISDTTGTHKDLQTIFPKTYQAFMVIGDQIYNYEGYMQTLRESFENDLSALTANLPSIIDNDPKYFNKHQDLAALLSSGCYIAEDLKDKVHPGDILNDYPSEYLKDLNPNLKGAIQTLQLISSSFRESASKKDTVYWVSSKQINQLVKDSIAFKIYLGLIYENSKHFNGDSIIFKNISLRALLGSIAKNYNTAASFITGFGSKADKLN